MRVLIVGNGGREHALAWSLAASPLLDKLYVAPGNPGAAAHGELVPIGVADIAALVAFARAQTIDLVVPGPEAPLVAGLADALAAAGIDCAGPTAAAAQLEGSKSFTKTLCDEAGIPTALWERFEDEAAALDFVRRRGAPIVVKADGLAAGKGVVVAETLAEAEAAIVAMMREGALGEAGRAVVIEECLTGDEVSLFALCDGEDAVLIGAAQDHKRLGDGDTGPNTGGMGAISPPTGFGRDLQLAAIDVFIKPALAAMARRGTPFRGVLFAGLMLTANGARLIEYNVRFGDPECQTLLPLLRGDLLAALVAACQGELGHVSLRLADRASVAVVIAARGYPGEPIRGTPIGGLDRVAAIPGVQLFHAGTARRGEAIEGAGGRVLTICATAADLSSARDAAYAGVAALDWPDGVWRRDIGLRALGNI